MCAGEGISFVCFVLILQQVVSLSAPAGHLLSAKSTPKKHVPVAFDVVATDISPLVQQKDLKFWQFPGTRHTNQRCSRHVCSLRRKAARSIVSFCMLRQIQPHLYPRDFVGARDTIVFTLYPLFDLFVPQHIEPCTAN